MGLSRKLLACIVVAGSRTMGEGPRTRRLLRRGPARPGMDLGRKGADREGNRVKSAKFRITILERAATCAP